MTTPLGLVDAVVFRPLVIDGDYPHMAKRDSAVWERWLKIHASHWQGVAYDVAVGGLRPAAGDTDIAFDRMWQYDTALKIDALVAREDRILVVEVRPMATVSAIGSALVYAMVLAREGVNKIPLVPAIVCEGIQVDVRWAAEQMQIQVFLV